MENQDTLSEIFFLNDQIVKETEDDVVGLQSELTQLVNDVTYDMFEALAHNSNVNSSLLSHVEQQIQVLDDTKSAISNFAEAISSFASLTRSLKPFDGNEPIVEKKIFVTRAQNTEESDLSKHNLSKHNLGKTFTSEDYRKSSNKRKSESKSSSLCVSPIVADEIK